MKSYRKLVVRNDSMAKYILKIATLGILIILAIVAYVFYLSYVRSFFRDSNDNYISILILSSSIIPIILKGISNMICEKFSHNRISIVLLTYFNIIINALFIIWLLLCLYWTGYLFARGNLFNMANQNTSYFITFLAISILLTIYPLIPNIFMQYPSNNKKDKFLVKQTCIDINRFFIFFLYFIFISINVNIDDTDSIIVQLFTVYIGFDRLYSIIKSNKRMYQQEFIYLYRQIIYVCMKNKWNEFNT